MTAHRSTAPARLALRRSCRLSDNARHRRLRIDALRSCTGLSKRPSNPEASNRSHHSETRLAAVASRSAMASAPTPSSRHRMMSARSRSRIPMVGERNGRRSSFGTPGSACSLLIRRPSRQSSPSFNRQANISRYLQSRTQAIGEPALESLAEVPQFDLQFCSQVFDRAGVNVAQLVRAVAKRVSTPS